ncbi:hypothetical protein [Actinomadura flavalba]|uniref:hypothetical protein n=1 Tax=Actinomadura flavalba TaxID=1120938 RepID=UPI00039E10DB|nr:hypothetical protein [Actinomadura flavalba]
MVGAQWWPGAAPQQRQHAIAGRVLALPDGSWWLFGAWARWYRLHPSDGQWYLCPPPSSPAVRSSARPGQGLGQTPQLPAHVVPAGPDFSYEAPPLKPFIGTGFSSDLAMRVRATLELAAALPAEEYPHWNAEFAQHVPSTVVVAWGVLLWCAGAPAFDARLDAQMLDLWSPYRARPLPAVDGPRWLTPPPLESLVALYAERLRAGRVDAAVVVLRTMWAAASALREDARFQVRADALLEILGSTIGNPTVDYGALPYGDPAIVQQWLTRCPPHLVPSLRNESSPGDNFRHAFYSLAETLVPLAGDPDDAAFIEPRLVAAALLAADLSVVRDEMASGIVPWLDPEVRYTVQAALHQTGHPLRRLWPDELSLAEPLRGAVRRAGRDAEETLLAAVYELDLAWCRLVGMPARPRGFPVPTAIIANIIGRDRARAASRTSTGTPAASPQPPPHSARSQPGFAPGTPQAPGARPGQERPFVQPPAESPQDEPARPSAAPQGWGASAPDAAPPEAPVDIAPPYTALGFGSAQPPQPAQPQPQQAQPQNAQPPVASPQPPAEPVVAPAPRTSLDEAAVFEGTRVDPGRRAATPPAPATRVGTPEPEAPKPPPPPGTRVMSETMIGDFGFLEDTPAPARPVEEIPPPQDRSDRRVLERFGIGFVSGPLDAGGLLDDVREQITLWNALDAAEETRVDGRPGVRNGVPSVLLVGSPHTGQRRLARLIALTMADAGHGDGALRAHEPGDVRGAPPDRVAALLTSDGPAILFEDLDEVVTAAPDPAAVAAEIRRARRSPATSTPLVATCDPSAFQRLRDEHPRLADAFQVYRLPDFSGVENRMVLLHLLADERRVTVGSDALETASTDLDRLRGPGDLVGARLVESYLDQACRRHLERAGASRDRLVLGAADLAGVAESIEPALRPPGDIDGHLAQLDTLTGLDEVKATVRRLAATAQETADRLRHGVGGKDPLHLIFTGPAGSGKTTVAGLLGGVYAALGLLDSGHVVECRPMHLAGRDRIDTQGRVAAMVEQALGGVLVIQDAERLDRVPAVVDELRAAMAARGARLMVVCAGPRREMEGFLAGNPVFRGEFGEIVEFEGMGDRELVRLFQSYADRDLYVLDEELRVELLTRFERLRDDPSFGFARTVRALFEQTVARQAARLARADVNAATVARLTAEDLP